MQTTVDEIAAGIYRLSTYVPDADFMFNQFLVDGEEPLLFHTGPRRMFPLVSEAIGRVIPIERLRWITFGHIEADESGAMNELLAVAPNAQVAHGRTGVFVSVMDLADREPRPLDDGEVIDTGGHRVRYLSTPHVPHGWDAGVYYDETTGTLLSGDLFTTTGASKPLVSDDLLEGALAAEETFRSTALTPVTAPTIRRLADLRPTTIALMHGPSFSGDARSQLLGLADAYEQRFAEAGGVVVLPEPRAEAATV